jgi:hypothetical protein
MGTFLGDFSAENDEVMIFLFDLQVQEEAQFDYLSLGPCKENGFSTHLFNKQKATGLLHCLQPLIYRHRNTLQLFHYIQCRKHQIPSKSSQSVSTVFFCCKPIGMFPLSKLT